MNAKVRDQKLQEIDEYADATHFYSRLLVFQATFVEIFTGNDGMVFTIMNRLTGLYELVSPSLYKDIQVSHRSMCELDACTFVHPKDVLQLKVVIDNITRNGFADYEGCITRFKKQSGDYLAVEWLDGMCIKKDYWWAVGRKKL